jgi:hypothetical protein
MVFYDTNSRLQFANEHADRLTTEMRRSRRLTPDETGSSRFARWGSALADKVGRLRRHGDRHAPVFGA